MISLGTSLAPSASSVQAAVAIAEPQNRTIELAGPEPIRMDELVRRFLIAHRDTRQVIADPHARYFGTPVDDQSLTPGDHPRLGQMHYADWLSGSPA